MEVRHLRYFAAVAELRNFTRAAERSFVAQSALSQQISRLEREVGAPLFVRTNRSVRLTPAGEVLLPHALRVIADVDRAQADMRSYLGLEKGRLQIGLIQTSASAVDILTPVTRFHDRYPDIEVHIVNQTSAEMVEGVLTGALDLAIVGLGPDDVPEGLEYRVLALDPLVAVTSEQASAGLTEPVSLPELLSRGPLIQFAPGTGIRRHVDEALLRAGLETTTPFEMNQAVDMLRFAALGLGVTVVPKALAHRTSRQLEELAAPYRTFALADTAAVHPVTVIDDRARRSAAATAFLSLLEEQPAHDTSDRSIRA
jgi:DNA-binding transcriptional LysR family regulator